MNLPFILDIGIGLIFIYLTLSFLASECQELLTTLLQWRAIHLKQSIETLLAGESKPNLHQSLEEFQRVQAQIDRSKELASALYAHPLVRSLEHESKGLIGSIAERVSQLTGTSSLFAGKASEPSYLPSDTFSTTLLELLSFEDIAQTLFDLKLKRCVDQTLLPSVLDLVDSLRREQTNELLLEAEWKKFQADVFRAVQTSDDLVSVSNRLSQISSVVKRFLLASEMALVEPEQSSLNHASARFLKQLAAIAHELPTLLKDTEPTLAEVTDGLKQMAWVAQLLQHPNHDEQTIRTQMTDATLQQRFQKGYDLLQTIKQTMKNSSQEQVALQSMLTKLSPHLCDSLELLTKQVQTETASIDQSINQLRKEVARWFDQSMDRSAGVYKRNAKGVALILGLLLAIATNTDTLHVINRLANDAALRATYSEAAIALVSTNPNAIACLQTEQGSAIPGACLNNGTTALRDAISRTTNVPIGWNATNWRQQWQPAHNIVVSSLKVLAGWLISAIAISMGAPFWFNLLNKVINVRNSGKPPASTSQTGASSS